jgi:hypothetical protein
MATLNRICQQNLEKVRLYLPDVSAIYGGITNQPLTERKYADRHIFDSKKARPLGRALFE